MTVYSNSRFVVNSIWLEVSECSLGLKLKRKLGTIHVYTVRSIISLD